MQPALLQQAYLLGTSESTRGERKMIGSLVPTWYRKGFIYKAAGSCHRSPKALKPEPHSAPLGHALDENLRLHLPCSLTGHVGR